MIIKSVNLEKVYGVTSKLEDGRLLEFAFAGKSNVGKSSLINALMNRKNYARVSENPGKTATINFYNINEDFYMVDLPGYGFAKVSKEVKEKWGNLIENYLNDSRMLDTIFLLVDIRHKPGENDILMYNYVVSQGYTPVVIATKLDKIKRSQISKQVKIIKDTLTMNDNDTVITFSSKTKDGREEILDYIENRISEYEKID